MSEKVRIKIIIDDADDNITEKLVERANKFLKGILQSKVRNVTYIGKTSEEFARIVIVYIEEEGSTSVENPKCQICNKEIDDSLVNPRTIDNR